MKKAMLNLQFCTAIRTNNCLLLKIYNFLIIIYYYTSIHNMGGSNAKVYW